MLCCRLVVFEKSPLAASLTITDARETYTGRGAKGGRDGGEGGEGGDGSDGGSDGGGGGGGGDGDVSRYAPLRQSLAVLQLTFPCVGHPPWATPSPAPWSHWN